VHPEGCRSLAFSFIARSSPTRFWGTHRKVLQNAAL
jgi:hypothetical protein